MKYPNGKIANTSHSKISAANRGMTLEEDTVL